jgi:HAD superfamily hydrolase (TIGR01549 family)
VADRLSAWLPAEIRHYVQAQAGRVTDPQVILRILGELEPEGELVSRLEEQLTEEELRATETAVPTENAAELIRDLSRADVGLAITTNNSVAAVNRYLERWGLTEYFEARNIHGRRKNPRLLKPHPDCLERALASTGASPGEAMMIGDAPHDYFAAKKVGVRFLGYATGEGKSSELYGVGAPLVIDKLPPTKVELADLTGQLS